MPNLLHAEAALQTSQDIARAFTAGAFQHLKLPIAFGTADAAVLFTVPTGIRLEVVRAWWEVTTSFTGGASSAIGVSSDDADYNTKGDILGGASGDVLATLVSTGRVHKGGTVGAKFGSNGVVALAGGKVLRFDRITSAFTAGVGFVHVDVRVVD
jgi:hypothetical protein